MGEIITDLYVEVYWYLYRVFKNKNIATVLDLFLLIAFQLLNIYSLVVISQKLLGIDVTGYFSHKPLYLILICSVVVVLNFLAGKKAKKTLKKDNSEMFVSRRFTTYVILSLVVFVASRFMPK